MTEETRTHVPGRASGFRLRVWQVAAAGVIAAALIGFGLWQVLQNGSSSSSTSPIPKGSSPVPITVEGLQTIASLGIVIYWAGEKPGFTYELTKTKDDRVFIRYLPGGVNVGSDKPYLTVGTYPVKNAFAATTKDSLKSSSVRIGIGKDSVAFYDRDHPTNVFLAYKGLGYEIEVYEPSKGSAQRIAASREVAAVR